MSDLTSLHKRNVFGGYCPSGVDKPITTEQGRKAFIFTLRNPFGTPPCQLWAKEDHLHMAVMRPSGDGVGHLFGNGYDLGILGNLACA